MRRAVCGAVLRARTAARRPPSAAAPLPARWPHPVAPSFPSQWMLRPRRASSSVHDPLPTAALRGARAQCRGCGVRLQTEAPAEPGFVPADRLRAHLLWRHAQQLDVDASGSEGSSSGDRPADVRQHQQDDQSRTAAAPSPPSIAAETPTIDDGSAWLALEQEHGPAAASIAVPTRRRSAREQPDARLVCKRCYMLNHYSKLENEAPNVHVVSEDELKAALGEIGARPVLLLCLADIFHFPGSLMADPRMLTGHRNPVVLAINKMDLLPSFVNPKRNMPRLRHWVAEEARRAGLDAILRGFHLVSARTGAGLAPLIQKCYDQCVEEKRDLVVVGRTNVGKSSLVNALVAPAGGGKGKGKGPSAGGGGPSADAVTRSSLPGTTIGLIPFRMARDTAPGATLPLRIVPTANTRPATGQRGQHVPLFLDTPGIVNPNSLLHHLTLSEANIVSPSKPIVPVTYVLKPGQTLMLAGLGRIDFVEGAPSIYLTVFLANKVPVHVTNAERAGELYARHAGQDLLQPPIGGPARMAAFPPLVPADYAIPGAGWKESAQDVAIAGLGWVAVTIGQGLEAKIRAWAPEGVEMCTRPALEPFAVNTRGRRPGKGQRARYDPRKPRK